MSAANPAVPQAAVVAAMSEPTFYGAAATVAHEETHISHVFLVGDRAFKLKKDLVLPFVDYGTLERRRFFCAEEIRLNRPLAPSVYLGVRSVVPRSSGFALAAEADPRAVEYLVEMRRFSDDETLAALVRARSADASIAKRVGAAMARLHEASPPVLERAGAHAFETRIGADLEQLEWAVAATHGPALQAAVRAARAFVERSAYELDARGRRGLIREGHGDLRLEHVLVGARIELVDCVEFDRALRVCDVAYDLAFAVMELHDGGDGALAGALIDGYVAAGGDPGPEPLLHGLAACRALVRAKIAALRTPTRRGELDHFLRLARALFWRARSPLTLIVCGPAATGKTTLAARLARASGLPHLNSDVVRKHQAGASPTARLGAAGYSDAASRETYAELGRLAREAATRSGSVVDATFRRSADRAAFDETFGRAPGTRVIVRLDLDASAAHARAAARAEDPARVSDAGPDLAVAQASEFEPFTGAWAEHATSLDARRAPAELADDAEAAIDALLA